MNFQHRNNYKATSRSIFILLLLVLFGTADVAQAQLTIYSGRSKALIDPLIQQFESETGINVRVRYGGTTQLAVAIMEEGERSPADIFWSQDAGALGAVHTEGMLIRLPESITGDFPEQFTNSAGSWVATSGRARVLAYNADRIGTDELPSSVFELTDSAFQDEVGWAPGNASFQSFVTAMRMLESDDRTLEWLRGMRENGAVAYNNNTSILQGIAAGEINYGITNHYYIDRARASNADYPIRMHFFEENDPGNLVNVAGMGVLQSSPNQEAALAFVRFVLRPESQAYFANEVFEYPVIQQGGNYDEDFQRILDVTPTLDLDALRDLDGTLQLLRETGLL